MQDADRVASKPQEGADPCGSVVMALLGALWRLLDLTGPIKTWLSSREHVSGRWLGAWRAESLDID